METWETDQETAQMINSRATAWKLWVLHRQTFSFLSIKKMQSIKLQYWDLIEDCSSEKKALYDTTHTSGCQVFPEVVSLLRSGQWCSTPDCLLETPSLASQQSPVESSLISKKKRWIGLFTSLHFLPPRPLPLRLLKTTACWSLFSLPLLPLERKMLFPPFRWKATADNKNAI